MKTLLSTTALVFALGFPAMTLAQTDTPDANTETAQQDTEMSGFIAANEQSDLFASDLMGHAVYAYRTQDEVSGHAGQSGNSQDGAGTMAMMDRSDLDEMENIGEITEIVLTGDGEVRALVIGVGGFLGLGEQNIAVAMDQVTVTRDSEDESQMFVVVNTSADMLQDAPAYDRMSMEDESGAERSEENRVALRTDTTANTDDSESMAANDADDMERENGMRDGRSAFMAPEMEREGYERVEVRDVSTEMLMDRTVYDTSDDEVGEVTDMILDDSGAVSDVIINFGGFLGFGESQASLGYEELTIMTSDGYEDVRVYVDATRQQIQELPRYLARN